MVSEVRRSSPSTRRLPGPTLTPASAHSRADFLYALRWTLGFAVVAVAYMVGVRQGVVPDVVSEVSESLTRNYIFKQQ